MRTHPSLLLLRLLITLPVLTVGAQRATAVDAEAQLMPRNTHQAPITSLAFSPDGLSLATGSYDTTARVWDVATATLKSTIKPNSGQVLTVDFSPDGQRLATGCFRGGAAVWNAGDGTAAGRALNTQGAVVEVRFAHSGAALTAVTNKTAYLWDWARGKQLTTVFTQTGPQFAVDLSPDGRLLACGSGGSSLLRLQPIPSGKSAEVRGRASGITTLRFSPNGKRLIVAESYGDLVLWDVAGRREIGRMKSEGLVHYLDFTSDGSCVAAGDEEVRVLNPALTRITRRIHVHDAVWSASLNGKDGKSIAVGLDDGSVEVWDIQSAACLTASRLHSSRAVVRFSPNGRTLASAAQDGNACLWDADKLSNPRVLRERLQ